MSKLMRVSFTIEESLYAEMEKLLVSSHYKNRSELIRDLLRERLTQDSWKNNEEAIGTITMVYAHHQRELTSRLLQVQHEFHDTILAATHVHLTHDLCAEMIMVRGLPRNIETLVKMLRREKGVLHVAVSISTTGDRFK